MVRWVCVRHEVLNSDISATPATSKKISGGPARSQLPERDTEAVQVTVVTDAARGLIIGGPVVKPLLESAAWLTAITVASWALNAQRYRVRV